MFKNFKKNDKYFTIAVYSFLVIAALICLIFVFVNFSKISSFFGGVIDAMMAFIYGFVFAYVCNPIYKRFHKYVFKFVDKKKKRPKLRKGLSIACAFIVFLIIISLLIWAIVPSFISNITLLVDNIDTYISNLTTWLNTFLLNLSESFPFIKPDEIIDNIFSIFNSEDGSSIITTILNFLMDNVINIGTIAVNQVFAIFVGFILSVYALVYKDSIVARLKRTMCALFKQKTYESIVSFTRFTDKTFGRYLLGTLVDSALVGLVVGVILAILRYPFAPLIGVIVGVTNVIPFFGPFLGAIPSALIILIATGDIWKVLIFVIMIFITQQIDGNLIAPHIHGASTGLTPIGVIAAVTLCSHLFGFVGMLIGVPICAIITYFISTMIDKKLSKKRFPTQADYYRVHDVFTDENFKHARYTLEAEARIKHSTAIANAKTENKIRDEVVHEVEERVIEEMLTTDLDEIKNDDDDDSSSDLSDD